MATTTHTHDTEVLKLYADYNVHHSGLSDPLQYRESPRRDGVMGEPQPEEFDPTLAPHPLVPFPVENPSWWVQSYRRVPDYRPANRNLDRSERAQTPVVTVIATVMLTGCSAMAYWYGFVRKTLGKVYSKAGIAKVGGEW